LARWLLPPPGMIPLPPPALANRFVDPLSHPWTALGGGLFSFAALDGQTLRTIVEASWRLLRLLLAL